MKHLVDSFFSCYNPVRTVKLKEKKGRIIRMKARDKAKYLIKKYSHAWVLLYVFIYMPWFIYLERHVSDQYYVIHSKLDDYIPFVEYFIVPYLLWFFFMAIVIAYFFFTDKRGFYKLTAFLFTGMTLFLIICTIFPNGLSLRPETFARDNVFVDLVKHLYQTDTPTNVLPSIHVFNSLGSMIAIARSKKLSKYRGVQIGIYSFGLLIIMSTVFLKQHSIIDVIAAFAMACVLYPLVYGVETKKVAKVAHQPI